jgi:pyruvate dehydrogenase (quinone)/pyruvate oxidase
VALPIDYQAMPASQEKRFKRNVPGHTSTAYQQVVLVPQRELLQKAAALLDGKKKVAILAGAGARGARDE